jgi:YspA, cpYpsA-related SLOG family
MSDYRVLVTVSRDWDDLKTIESALYSLRRDVRGEDILIVHGASQMDWAIAGMAYAMRMYHEPHPADWTTHKRAAGPIRNQEMVDAGADICLAFIKNNSRGASDCARRAEAAGIAVRRVIA